MTNDQELARSPNRLVKSTSLLFKGKAMKNFCSTAAAGLLAVVALLGGPSVAIATPLIAFTDGSPGTGSEAFLSDNINWAVFWTQTTASSNVTLSAILDSNVGVTSANWYVTKAIGTGTTVDDVVFSGTYSPLTLTSSQTFDFNTVPRTVLGTGLNFAAGTYYLVLDGPIGPFSNNGQWIGDFSSITTTLAPGFSIGSYFSSSNGDSFAPASAFVPNTSSSKFVFELDAVNRTVPEPTSLALLGLGLAGLGFTRRRKRA